MISLIASLERRLAEATRQRQWQRVAVLRVRLMAVKHAVLVKGLN